jgi:hypothetical protein
MSRCFGPKPTNAKSWVVRRGSIDWAGSPSTRPSTPTSTTNPDRALTAVDPHEPRVALAVARVRQDRALDRTLTAALAVAR